jgi:hypothetical protein
MSKGGSVKQERGLRPPYFRDTITKNLYLGEFLKSIRRQQIWKLQIRSIQKLRLFLYLSVGVNQLISLIILHE